MLAAIRRRLTYSNTIATLALFLALGGAALAAGLPRNSIGTKQLKRRAVTAAKLAPQSVIAGKLGPNSVGPGNIGNGAVNTAKLAQGSVIATTIKNGVVTTNKLTNEAVTAAKLAKGSVTPAKLSDEIAPLLGTLRSGQTLRGSFDLGGEAKVARWGISFQFPLNNAPAAPEANVLPVGTSSTACPGVSGGNQQTPQAAPGQLCLYVSSQSPEYESLTFDAGSVNRLGFGLLARFKGTADNFAQGFWAVTAP
jgi:hypothetical protein